ncbi:hypothetical protein J6590_070860 [Homalodisca vitripennis]|nr:hypothetical protein J6590_070860 [Homalodisca vitripennis]
MIKTSNKKHISQQKSIKKQDIGFNTVVIRGDSHARCIAGLLGEMVNSEVTGLERDSATPTPPVAGTRCDLLIAGTNGLASREQQNIYRHLENYMTTRPANTSLVISTLPYRHDLPGDDGTNQDIGLVNAYIQELAVRHDGRFLEFNQLAWKMFTRHGMHLSQQGKRKLAGLIQRSLANMHKLISRPSRKVPPPSSGEPPSPTMQSPIVATAEPRCLPVPSPEPAADTMVPYVPPSPATPWTSPHNSYVEAGPHLETAGTIDRQSQVKLINTKKQTEVRLLHKNSQFATKKLD